MRADLIVLGAASRSRVGRLLLGSTAHAVLNLAPCDVLLVGQDTMKQNEETG
jgi:nucleotide-binding universal stress UspA family protein